MRYMDGFRLYEKLNCWSRKLEFASW
jgi:hypothetical protein